VQPLLVIVDENGCGNVHAKRTGIVPFGAAKNYGMVSPLSRAALSRS
jgi:hypothetical protein